MSGKEVDKWNRSKQVEQRWTEKKCFIIDISHAISVVANVDPAANIFAAPGNEMIFCCQLSFLDIISYLLPLSQPLSFISVLPYYIYEHFVHDFHTWRISDS